MSPNFDISTNARKSFFMFMFASMICSININKLFMIVSGLNIEILHYNIKYYLLC